MIYIKIFLKNKKYNSVTTQVSMPIDTIFKKKVCKNCNSKLKRFVVSEEDYKGDKTMGLTTYSGNHYKSEINYKCEKCGSIYNINDFSDKKKDM